MSGPVHSASQPVVKSVNFTPWLACLHRAEILLAQGCANDSSTHMAADACRTQEPGKGWHGPTPSQDRAGSPTCSPMRSASRPRTARQQHLPRYRQVEAIASAKSRQGPQNPRCVAVKHHRATRRAKPPPVTGPWQAIKQNSWPRRWRSLGPWPSKQGGILLSSHPSYPACWRHLKDSKADCGQAPQRAGGREVHSTGSRSKRPAAWRSLRV
jgi:hypothetical protein